MGVGIFFAETEFLEPLFCFTITKSFLQECRFSSFFCGAPFCDATSPSPAPAKRPVFGRANLWAGLKGGLLWVLWTQGSIFESIGFYKLNPIFLGRTYPYWVWVLSIGRWKAILEYFQGSNHFELILILEQWESCRVPHPALNLGVDVPNFQRGWRGGLSKRHPLSRNLNLKHIVRMLQPPWFWCSSSSECLTLSLLLCAVFMDFLCI